MSRLFSFFFEKPRMTVVAQMASPLLEIALVLVRFDHVASVIVNANHKILLFTLSSLRSLCSEKP
jgi:hypothetical protein